MMQEEYEKMVGHDVDAKYYEWVEVVYLNHPAFECPDDVRQFVRGKGGEDRMDELVTMAKNIYHDREDDERTIVELTRQARAAEGAAREAEELRRKAQAEAEELRAKLRAIQDALCGLVFPEEVA